MKKLRNLIKALEAEVVEITKQRKSLSKSEISKIEEIHGSLNVLRQAEALVEVPKQVSNNFITYKISSDLDGRLKTGARVACNFWNRFVSPATPIVIRLGTFRSGGSTIARAYYPYSNEGIKFGRVEFNTKYLKRFEPNEIAGTIVHEIGHTLGFGWDTWNQLFDKSDGKFFPDAVKQLSALKNMRIELTGGSGTRYSHWDEDEFGEELMTGYKDNSEYVLPVTIDIMEVLGHSVLEQLESKTKLNDLLNDVEKIIFSRKEEAEEIDTDYFEETSIFEEIPH